MGAMDRDALMIAETRRTGQAFTRLLAFILALPEHGASHVPPQVIMTLPSLSSASAPCTSQGWIKFNAVACHSLEREKERVPQEAGATYHKLGRDQDISRQRRPLHK